jgi:hypothetical protein
MKISSLGQGGSGSALGDVDILGIASYPYPDLVSWLRLIDGMLDGVKRFDLIARSGVVT